MSKTRDTGFLGNIIKVDTSGNVSFVSGSTTLATINTSGQLSGSSPVLSSSYALNADLLDGLDSTQFTLTSSFAAQTASFTAFTASVNSFTASQLVLNGTYATTGSNTFAGIQTINSNLVVTGSITAQTLVVQTITSSVDFVTGSTRFGSILGNTHIFSGSVTMNPGGLFVSSSGNVGIGLINPTQKLEVTSGSIKISSNGYGLILPGSIHTSAQINFYNANTAIELMKLPVANNTITFYANTDKLYYHSDKGSVGNFFALTTDGNVGIGTITPEGPLHIFGTNSAGYYGMVITNYGTATNTSTGIDFGVDASAAYNAAGNAQIKVINTNSADNRADMTFSTYNGATFGERLRIASNGYIGIGTTSPATVFANSSTRPGNADGLSVHLSSLNWSVNGQGYAGAIFNTNSGAGNYNAGLLVKIASTDANDKILDLESGGVNRFRMLGTGAATFSSDIQGGGDLYFNKGSRTTIYPTTTNQNLHMKSNGSGVLQFNNDNTGNLTMCIGGGNVGIRTANPGTHTLFVYGDLCVQGSGAYGLIQGYDDAFHGLICRGYPTTATNLTDITAGDVMTFYEYGGDFRFYQKNPSTLTLQAKILTGNMVITGTLTQNGSPSDINLKENLVKITSPLEKISQINGYTFDWKEGSPSRSDVLYIVEDAGLIAQEVEAVLPQTVRENGNYKALNYNGISALLVEAIKELKAENDTLKEILQRNNIQ
jgi:hypothetical protein